MMIVDVSLVNMATMIKKVSKYLFTLVGEKAENSNEEQPIESPSYDFDDFDDLPF